MCPARCRPFLFGLAVGCLTLTGVCPGEAIAADWKERLLAEAPPKWAALEKYYSKLEVSFRSNYTTKPKPPPLFPDSVSFDIRKNGDMMVSTQRRLGTFPDGKRMDDLDVNGVNSRYAFTLGKTSPDAESFLLANFQPASDEARENVHGCGEHQFGIVFEVNSWDCIPLAKFIKDPFVTITDVRGVRRGEREMAQLSYERQMEKPNGSKGKEHGTVVLDPDHFWCVRESHSELPDFMPVHKIDHFLEYGEDVDGFPILRREQDTTTYKDGEGTLATTTEFDKLVHRDIPENEFTLSAFGLPEMQLPGEQNPPTLWRWLVGIGIALGVLAILLRVYVKKRRREAAQKV